MSKSGNSLFVSVIFREVIWTVSSAASWFATARHDLRHGEVQQIITTLNKVATETDRGADRNGIIRRVANYLSSHEEHLRFPEFHAQDLPLAATGLRRSCGL